MILAIDVGNTNVVIGAMKGEQIEFMERVSTDPGRTELEYLTTLKAVLEIHEISSGDISGAIISSVVPHVTGSFSAAISKLLHITPLVVGPGIKTGLNIRTDDPAETGADLIVDSVAAVRYYGYPCIIIDMGTATTISIVDKNGAFAGGAIMPGVRISMDALASRTAALPRINIEAPKKVISTNTVDCMKSGIVFAQAAMIDGMVSRMEEEMGCPATVIATGGLAGAIVKHCKCDVIYDNELTLKGLYLIYEKNMK